MTKKEFLIQAAASWCNLLLGLFWLVTGIAEHEAWKWIIGLILFLCAVGLIVSLFIQWKRKPIVDEERDKVITKRFKESYKGLGITFAFLIGGFLLAFGLVWLLK